MIVRTLRFHGKLIGINCTALDQSKLSSFVECTIIGIMGHFITIIASKLITLFYLLLQNAVDNQNRLLCG